MMETAAALLLLADNRPSTKMKLPPSAQSDLSGRNRVGTCLPSGDLRSGAFVLLVGCDRVTMPSGVAGVRQMGSTSSVERWAPNEDFGARASSSELVTASLV